MTISSSSRQSVQFLCYLQLQLNNIIQYYQMRATIQELSPNQSAPTIQIICNQMEPIYVEPHLATKKYKKVSKTARARLLKCIEKGWTIINVSKKFGINYSTAKSIVQNQKKKTFKSDHKTSSTESFSIEEESLAL